MEKIRICNMCIYDEYVPGIKFDEEGICNYCRIIKEMEKEYPNDEHGYKMLLKIVEKIKKEGKNKKYDCVIGVSGGCDSSYMVYKMIEFGLRPLAVHYDNTWSSTISTENIKNVLKNLNVDLYTLVVDNKEQDDIYRSFFLSGTRDIDAPTDIGLAATLRIAAAKYKVKYIIEGHNFRTEGISPLGMQYMDGKYVQYIHKKFGTVPMKTFPNMTMIKFLKWIVINRSEMVRPLYYLNYNKSEVMSFMEKELGWKWYGGHHLENRYTAFTHSYFYPTRWKIDTRILGYAALVRSGQITREKGLEMLKEPQYVPDGLINLVKKRFGLSDEEFEKYMNLPKKTFRDYKTYKKTFEYMKPFFWLMYKLNRVPKSFYNKFTSKLS
jgi:N-acetyl sugar amidotransferase